MSLSHSFYENKKRKVEKLVFMCIDKNLKKIKKLLDNGVSPNVPYKKWIPLGVAVDDECPEIVDLLLKYNADPNGMLYTDSDYSCFGAAQLHGSLKIMYLLLKEDITTTFSPNQATFRIFGKALHDPFNPSPSRGFFCEGEIFAFIQAFLNNKEKRYRSRLKKIDKLMQIAYIEALESIEGKQLIIEMEEKKEQKHDKMEIKNAFENLVINILRNKILLSEVEIAQINEINRKSKNELSSEDKIIQKEITDKLEIRSFWEIMEIQQNLKSHPSFLNNYSEFLKKYPCGQSSEHALPLTLSLDLQARGGIEQIIKKFSNSYTEIEFKHYLESFINLVIEHTINTRIVMQLGIQPKDRSLKEGAHAICLGWDPKNNQWFWHDIALISNNGRDIVVMHLIDKNNIVEELLSWFKQSCQCFPSYNKNNELEDIDVYTEIFIAAFNTKEEYQISLQHSFFSKGLSNGQQLQSIFKQWANKLNQSNSDDSENEMCVIL